MAQYCMLAWKRQIPSHKVYSVIGIPMLFMSCSAPVNSVHGILGTFRYTPDYRAMHLMAEITASFENSSLDNLLFLRTANNNTNPVFGLNEPVHMKMVRNE